MKYLLLSLSLIANYAVACDSQQPKAAGEWPPTRPTKPDVTPDAGGCIAVAVPRQSRFSRLKFRRLVVNIPTTRDGIPGAVEQRVVLVPYSVHDEEERPTPPVN